MTDLILLAPDAPTLSMLAQRLDGVAGVRVIQDQRRSERRTAREHVRTREERSGRERRAVPVLKGTFALTERP